MATARPFAYNIGSPIPGTEQVGSLAIGAPTSGFTNNPQFWNGPDEDLGFVIAAPASGNTQPTPISGVDASVGFYRTDGFGESEFIDLAEIVSNEYGNPQTFTSAGDASFWLTNNGFWNSYVAPPTPTPTNTPTRTAIPTVTPTRTPTRTPNPTPTPTNTPNPPTSYLFYRPEGGAPQAPLNNGGLMLVAGGDVVTYNPNDSFEIVFTEIDKSGTSHPEYNDLLTYGGSITLTQGGNTYIASGDSGFFSYTVNPGGSSYYAASYLDVIQLSSNPFVSGSTIFLTVSVFYPPTPTPTSSQTPTLTTTPTPTPTRPAYLYYRWQITETKVTPPDNNAVQAAEFVFQIGGVDQSMAGVTVTNPSGNNPSGETPSNLVDNNLTTKALDLNFVTNGLTNFIFQFSSAKSFNGYRWATANDFDTRDPKSWTIAGSNNGTTWTTLSTVSNFTATVARDTWQTPQTY